MNTLINTSSYLGLFIIAIISGTFLPGPSDPAIIGMIAFGFSPWGVLTVASAGIIIARVINYHIGMLGEEYVVQRKHWLKTNQVERSKKLFKNHGSMILLLTWIPFIDDPLTIVAGFLKFPFKKYMIYTSIAVLVRHVGLYALYKAVA